MQEKPNNKEANILVIVPRFVERGNFYNFPHGLGYVSSSLKEAGFNVSCLNLCHETDDTKTALSKAIQKNNTNIICTGAMSTHWTAVEELLNDVKEISQDLITIVGGALVTAHPTLTLENMKVDYGVIGEGEETTVELVKSIIDKTEKSEVLGITYCDPNGKVVINKHRPSIMDLDALPFPDYEGLEYGTWIELCEKIAGNRDGILYDYDNPRIRGEVSASRSCPYNCTFCYHPLGNRYRQRSLDNVFKEIEYLMETYHINSIIILDELLSRDEPRINEFTERIKKTGLQWAAQWRVDNISVPLLQKLKDSNIMQLSIGVESMSDVVLKSMKKKITKKQVEDALEMSSQVGVRCLGNIILGDVAETPETIHESVSWCEEHPEYDLQIRHVKTIPDSEIWQYAVENGLIKDKIEHLKLQFPIINITSMTDKQFFGNKRKIDFESAIKGYLMAGKVLRSVIIDTVDNKPIYQFDTWCPLCNKVSTYKHPVWTYFPNTTIMCKHCLKRLKVPTYKITNDSYINQLKSITLMYLYAYYKAYLYNYGSIRAIASRVHKLIKVKKDIS